MVIGRLIVFSLNRILGLGATMDSVADWYVSLANILGALEFSSCRLTFATTVALNLGPVLGLRTFSAGMTYYF